MTDVLSLIWFAGCVGIFLLCTEKFYNLNVYQWIGWFIAIIFWPVFLPVGLLIWLRSEN